MLLSTYLLDQGGKVDGGEWCLLGRLDDRHVPCRQCWGNLPGEHHGWVVPLDIVKIKRTVTAVDLTINYNILITVRPPT